MQLEHLKGIVHSDPNIMGGTPVFVGTRVPLQNLIDYLEGGESIEDFLDGFPSVKGTELHQTMPLMPKVLALLPNLKPGQVVRVTA